MSAVARRYYVRAQEHLRHGDVEAARDNLRAAVELSADFVAARVAFATILARTGEAPRAADLLRDALARELRPHARVALLGTLGDVLISTGGQENLRAAEDAYTQVARDGELLGASQRNLHDRLARLRAKNGRFAEALAELLAAARS